MDDQLTREAVLKLLDWPILAFVAMAVFVLTFRRSIQAALRRGDIMISWGPNRSIRVSKLGEGLTEELDPIRDELEMVKAAIAKLESQDPASAPPVSPVTAEHTLSNAEETAIRQRMRDALANGRYVWRSVERLAILCGISESQALAMVRSDSEIVLGLGKSGRQIARLTSRAQA